MTDAAETYFKGAAELQPRPISDAQWSDAVEAYQRAKLMKDAVDDLVKAFAQQSGNTSAQIRFALKARADSKEDEARDDLQGSVDSELGRTAEHLQDALAALAELERERDELRETVSRLNRRAQALEAGIAEKIASHPPGSMGRALANAAAEMYHSRAQKAETERDELRAKLAEIYAAPTVAVVKGEYGLDLTYRYPFSDKPPPVGTELIARPTRKDGE